MMTTITLTHVTKRFEQTVGESRQMVTAVNNLSLKVLSGETLAILGPSGCGKSTVLRIIAGLTIPDSGEVLFDLSLIHPLRCHRSTLVNSRFTPDRAKKRQEYRNEQS